MKPASNNLSFDHALIWLWNDKAVGRSCWPQGKLIDSVKELSTTTPEDREASDWFVSNESYRKAVSKWKAHITDPVCPDCGGEMVKASIEWEDGTWSAGWICDCEVDQNGDFDEKTS